MPGHNPASPHRFPQRPRQSRGRPFQLPEHVVQATPPTHLDPHAGEDDDVLADDTFDAFAGAVPAPAAPERTRTRRGGPHAPLPLLPLIGLCAGIGIAYVAQTAHITQMSYQETTLAGEQAQLRSETDQLAGDLARLSSPERIDAAAQRLGLKPPSKWAYVVAVPAPIAAPATTSDPTKVAPGSTPIEHVVQASVGSIGDGAGAPSGSTGRTP